MDVSMQMRDLANAVGEDFAMNAPDDTARLVGKARRGRMVWTTGVGAAVVGSAASLAFGGPALASALTSGPVVAPAASNSATPSADVSESPSAEVSESPSPEAIAPLPGAGVIDLTGGAGVGDDDSDDDSADDSSSDDVSSDDDSADDSSSDDVSSDDSSSDDHEGVETHSEDPKDHS